MHAWQEKGPGKLQISACICRRRARPGAVAIPGVWGRLQVAGASGQNWGGLCGTRVERQAPCPVPNERQGRVELSDAGKGPYWRGSMTAFSIGTSSSKESWRMSSGGEGAKEEGDYPLDIAG